MDETSIAVQRPWLDLVVGKVISRKFLSWIVGTTLLIWGGFITADQWIALTSVYIGGQSLVDAITTLKRSG